MSFYLTFKRLSNENGEWKARFTITFTDETFTDKFVKLLPKKGDNKTPDDFHAVSLHLIKSENINETNREAFAEAQKAIDKNPEAKAAQKAGMNKKPVPIPYVREALPSF